MNVKAKPIQVTLAGLELNCFVDVDNPMNRYVSSGRLAEIGLISSLPQNVSKSLKAIAGKELELFRLTRVGQEGGNVTAISTSDFTTLLGLIAQRGNELAINLLVVLAQEAIDRRIDHALGIVLEEEIREEWSASRLSGKFVRRSLTDAIQDWLIRHEHDPKGNYAKFQVYAKVSDLLNLAIFGKTAKVLKEEKQLTYRDLLRDNVKGTELELIKQIVSVPRRKLYGGFFV